MCSNNGLNILKQKVRVSFEVEAHLKTALDAVGIFRKSGTDSEINRLMNEYNAGKDVDLSKVEDVNVVAGCTSNNLE